MSTERSPQVQDANLSRLIDAATMAAYWFGATAEQGDQPERRIAAAEAKAQATEAALRAYVLAQRAAPAPTDAWLYEYERRKLAFVETVLSVNGVGEPPYAGHDEYEVAEVALDEHVAAHAVATPPDALREAFRTVLRENAASEGLDLQHVQYISAAGIHTLASDLAETSAAVHQGRAAVPSDALRTDMDTVAEEAFVAGALEMYGSPHARWNATITREAARRWIAGEAFKAFKERCEERTGRQLRESIAKADKVLGLPYDGTDAARVALRDLREALSRADISEVSRLRAEGDHAVVATAKEQEASAAAGGNELSGAAAVRPADTREPDGWMNVEQAERLQTDRAITGTVHRVPPTGEQYVSIYFGTPAVQPDALLRDPDPGCEKPDDEREDDCGLEPDAPLPPEQP